MMKILYFDTENEMTSLPVYELGNYTYIQYLLVMSLSVNAWRPIAALTALKWYLRHSGVVMVGSSMHKSWIYSRTLGHIQCASLVTVQYRLHGN